MNKEAERLGISPETLKKMGQFFFEVNERRLLEEEQEREKEDKEG